MTCRKSKVFYSSNKEITLDEVILSNYIRKIESQLSWPGSSLGHQQSRGCRRLYCTSKKRFKGIVFSLSTWACSAGATREVTEHILGAAGSLGVLFNPLHSFTQQQKQVVWFLSLVEVTGRDSNAEVPAISGFCFKNFYSVAKSALISENFPILFSVVSVRSLTSKLHIYNFPTIRCQLHSFFFLFLF